MANRRGEEVYLDVTHDVKPKYDKSQGWPKRRRCLDLNVKLLFGCGLWRAEGHERQGPLYYWRYFYPRAQIIRMLYSIVFQAINISLVWGNFASMAEHLVMCLAYMLALSKCVTILFYQDTIHEMTNTLERMVSPRITPNRELRISMAKVDRFAHYLTKYTFITSMSTITLLAIFLFTLGLITHTIPFRLWFPYDSRSSPAFELTLLFVSALFPVDFSLIYVCDALFVALNINIVEQFHVLSHKLRHVRAIVEANRKNKQQVLLLSDCLGLPTVMADSQMRGGESRDVRERREQDSFTVMSNRSTGDNGGDMVEKGTEREDKTKLKRERRNEEVETGSELMTNSSEIKINSDMERFFKECIKHHQKLIRLCSQLDGTFKLMLSFQVFCNICCGLIMLYVTTLARVVDVKVVTFVTAAILCYLDYFLFCWYGNRITEESLNVRDAIYDCDWFGASESFKRSMRIMILRTNRLIIIRAGGLPLSMRTFKRIYKASYYMNMILSKLFHGEKMI